MTTVVSAANLGGVADSRLGGEADAIGTTEEHRGGISDEIAAPDTHGHNTIYLDSSIMFENYHYWANRSREFEKHIRTDNAGLAQVSNMILGRKIPNEAPIVENSESNPNGNAEKELDNEQGNGTTNEKVVEKDAAAPSNRWTHDITESEWEQAQRATRTATWGE
jgi:hypothetical protein